MKRETIKRVLDAMYLYVEINIDKCANVDDVLTLVRSKATSRIPGIGFCMALRAAGMLDERPTVFETNYKDSQVALGRYSVERLAGILTNTAYVHKTGTANYAQPDRIDGTALREMLLD